MNQLIKRQKTNTQHAPHALLMVRPNAFEPNKETAQDNYFQSQLSYSDIEIETIANTAQTEFDQMVSILRSHDIQVYDFETLRNDTPDAVFPNNWLTTHQDGTVITYPMYCLNRRNERRQDIINWLKQNYYVKEHIDLSYLEHTQDIVEGTGAMVFDHIAKLAYACLSQRANALAIENVCKHLGYTPVMFDAHDKQGHSVYHTNVLMSITSQHVIIATEMLAVKDKNRILSTIAQTGKRIFEISALQVSHFAGNCLEVLDVNGRSCLVISNSAIRSLNQLQLQILRKNYCLIGINIPTIELAGGSVRCMMAGVHLPMRELT